MTKKTQDDYEVAYDIGLDALDRLSASGVDECAGLASLLTVVMHSVFAMAPGDAVAEEMIAFATSMARENWADEKRERGAL